MLAALSFRSGGGTPREGWTREFIVNPRELINQYANETNTNIFDLNDHTPKTLVTEKFSTVEVAAGGGDAAAAK